MFFVHSTSASNEINLTLTDLNTGLYIEELASIKTFYTEWKLVTYINLSIYMNDFNKLNEMLVSADQVCSTILINANHNYPDDFTRKFLNLDCNKILDQLISIIKELEDYHSKWFISNTIPIRSKRGLIDPIGSLSKFLFGTLAEEDAKVYSSQFEKLQKYNQDQDIIINRQTTLIQSAVNMLNNSLSATNSSVNILYSQVTHLVKKSATYIDFLLLKNLFDDILDYLTLAIMQFSNNQKIFLNAISLGPNNMNNPNLIPPKMFFDQLKKIQNIISTQDLDLPIPLTSKNLATFYQISKAESSIVDNNLIICFTLPLISTQTYTLYKSTSFPYRIQNNLFSYIIPHYEYVALDSVKDKYIPITNNELENCLQISNTYLICKETFPIMSAINTKICEINLLRMEKVDKECNIRVSNLTSELWIKLREPNSYIFTLPKKQFVYIHCPNNTYNQFLENTGVIHLTSGCKIKTNSLTLHAFQTISTFLYRELIPIIKIDLNITELIQNVSLIKNFHIPEINFPTIFNFGQYKQLEEISFGLDDIEQLQNKLINKLSPSDIKSDIWTIFWIICILFLSVLLIIIRYFFKKARKIQIKRIISIPIEIPPPQSPNQQALPFQQQPIPLHRQPTVFSLSTYPNANIMDSSI